MKKIFAIFIMLTALCSFANGVKSDVYIKSGDKNSIALEKLLIEKFGDNYNYRQEYKLFTIELSAQEKIDFIEFLEASGLEIEHTERADAFIVHTPAIVEEEPVKKLEEEPVVEEVAISESINPALFKIKEFKISSIIEYEDNLEDFAKDFAKKYGSDIQELKSSLRFSILNTKLDDFKTALRESKDFILVEDFAPVKFQLKNLPMSEFRIRILLSDKSDVAAMIALLKSCELYIIDDAFESYKAGVLAAEFKILSKEETQAKVLNAVAKNARKIYPKLKDSDIKINRVSYE